jgi:hyperosmotically inducible protein
MKGTKRSFKQRHLVLSLLAGIVGSGLWLSGLPALAHPQVGLGGPGQQTTSPDNTGVNKRDRNGTEPTAGQQKQNDSDRDISRRIRQAIQKDKSMSTYGHNVKIISQNGAVTLRGPVRSADEKNEIEAIASKIAGEGNVKSELTVVPAKEKSKEQ